MIVGHADKIRMQVSSFFLSFYINRLATSHWYAPYAQTTIIAKVRHIGKDGKIYIDSDSFLPPTLIGHRVKLFTTNNFEDEHAKWD